MDINDIKDKQYFYVIDTKEFAGMLGFKRFGTFVTEETVFEHIPKKVLKDCKNNKCFIVFNYGFEGFSSSWQDTLLFKPLFDKFHEKIKQYNLKYTYFHDFFTYFLPRILASLSKLSKYKK